MYLASDIVIRRATKEDVDLYFKWVNDSSVRENSFNTERVKLNEHQDWFNERLKRENVFLYVFELDSVPFGQVRYEVDKEAIIYISIQESHRGKGLGGLMVEMSLKKFFGENPDKDSVYAYIKETNESSIKMFEKAGFSFSRSDMINNTSCVVLKAEKYIS